VDTSAEQPARTWPILAAGLVGFAGCLLIGGDTGLWLPALGVGVALVAWTSWWILPLLTLEVLLFRLLPDINQLSLLDGFLLAAQIGLSWWAYHTLARGSRWLEDPRSCMLFLVLVPGLIAAGFALAQALIWRALRTPAEPLWQLFGALWLSRSLGLLVPLPLLLVLLTPLLARHRLIHAAPPLNVQPNPWQRWSTGEAAEVSGLALSSALLVLVLLGLQVQQDRDPGLPPWSLWGIGLMIVVWSALRQGLRGGVVVAGSAALAGLAVAASLPLRPADGGLLQGYLLAQSSTALLVGVSAGWIQASEARFRHVVSEVPLVLYSARLPRPLPSPFADRGKRDSKADGLGPTISREAIVTLVSQASRQVFELEPEELSGVYTNWLSRIVPEDRELLIGALGQLGLQRQPVTCEYRILAPGEMAAHEAANGTTSGNPLGERWVRDTLTPHHTDDGLLDGWEGFVEDITERRKLSYNLRRSTTMLQALVANLPAGVFFVQGPEGYPILANARARQLLGQREDASVPLAQLSRQYRLHRPDGSEYPPDELPVARALRQGVSCTANDIVIHRPDGRRVPLVTWAAPVEFDAKGRPDAVVWVLEELTAFQQAESMRRESETLLRAVIETLANGVLVQDAAGTVIECNRAACTILGVSRERLLGRVGLCGEAGGQAEDGRPLPCEQCPDMQAAQTGEAVRDRVIGIASPGSEGPRWLLVNSLLLPAGPLLGANPRRARVVTSFVDITERITAGPLAG
jgi:PAS domain-containing protein